MIGLPFILAQAQTPGVSLPVDATTLLVGMVVLALPAIIGALNGVLSIIKWFRPDPPAHTTYATKTELANVESRMNGAVKAVLHDIERLQEKADEHNEKSDRYRESLSRELHAIARQMSEVYGMLKKKP